MGIIRYIYNGIIRRIRSARKYQEILIEENRPIRQGKDGYSEAEIMAMFGITDADLDSVNPEFEIEWLVPPPGLYDGQIVIAPDFDEPLNEFDE